MENHSALKRKEILTYATSMNFEDTMLSEISNHNRTNIVVSSLHEVPIVVKFFKKESTMVVARSWGERGT